jgi:hypothetical protein
MDVGNTITESRGQELKNLQETVMQKSKISVYNQGWLERLNWNYDYSGVLLVHLTKSYPSTTCGAYLLYGNVYMYARSVPCCVWIFHNV